MYGGIVAGTSSSDFSALSSSLQKRESLMREGYGDGREECGDTVYSGPQTQYCVLSHDSELTCVVKCIYFYYLRLAPGRI